MINKTLKDEEWLNLVEASYQDDLNHTDILHLSNWKDIIRKREIISLLETALPFKNTCDCNDIPRMMLNKHHGDIILQGIYFYYNLFFMC